MIETINILKTRAIIIKVMERVIKSIMKVVMINKEIINNTVSKEIFNKTLSIKNQEENIIIEIKSTMTAYQIMTMKLIVKVILYY